MKHKTYLETTRTARRPFPAAMPTYTVRCQACGWQSERLGLEDACAVALGHEKDHEGVDNTR